MWSPIIHTFDSHSLSLSLSFLHRLPHFLSHCQGSVRRRVQTSLRRECFGSLSPFIQQTPHRRTLIQFCILGFISLSLFFSRAHTLSFFLDFSIIFLLLILSHTAAAHIHEVTWSALSYECGKGVGRGGSWKCHGITDRGGLCVFVCEREDERESVWYVRSSMNESVLFEFSLQIRFGVALGESLHDAEERIRQNITDSCDGDPWLCQNPPTVCLILKI